VVAPRTRRAPRGRAGPAIHRAGRGRGRNADLQITSPLGRTGLPGTIRIVARLDNAGGDVPTEVQFLVDGQPLSSDTDGPPYEALWHDENPFEQRELKARAVFPRAPR
jgi:hypothetical protein